MIGRIYERGDQKFQVVATPIDPFTAIEHVVYKCTSPEWLDHTWVLPLSTFVQDFTEEQLTTNKKEG